MKETKEHKFATELIKTIGEDDDVENFSEDSDEEIQLQPVKSKKRKLEFDNTFDFISSVEEYNKNVWDDVHKYVRRKASTKTDDKITKVREAFKTEDLTEVHEINIDETLDSDNSLDSEDLQHDYIKIRQKKGNKKMIEEEPQQDQDFYSYDNNVNFYQMNLSRPLLKAITQMKFIHPTPIQAATIPQALLGKDIYGCAATGTGKTAAYMLPTLERLIYRPGSTTPTTRVLTLVPTRELGVQVYQVSKQLAQFTNIQIGLAIGGLDLKTQENVLRQNPDIVVATPGRLIDHLQSTPNFNLNSIEILILDEADRMLDEYFAEQMKEIIKQCSRTRQTMLFSATMTDQVNDLAAVSLKNPVKIFVDNNTDIACNLRQEFVRIRSNKESDREPILAALICRTFRNNCIIFVQTKKQAHRLHILLGLLGVKVGELHGNLTQLQRLDALEKFKTEQIDVLVATDVAARGLDIIGIKTVINFVMPPTLEHYIHRVGRTARAGRAGVSVSLAGEQERKMVKEVVKYSRQSLKSRIIAGNIIENYRIKLQNLEDKIEQILKEEYQEKLLNRTENQLNRAQKLLQGEEKLNKPWFQTPKERKEEKERLALKPQQKNKKANKSEITKNKNTKKRKSADDRAKDELERVALIQARLTKRKSKLKKIHSYNDNATTSQKRTNKSKSNFVNDLCNTTKSNTRKLRYETKLNNKQFKKKSNKKRTK